MSLEHNRIGLIEDDPIMGESLLQRLSLEGAHVTWWRTKQDAIKGLEALDPDVVICDIRLPDGNGEDVFWAARHRSDVRFLFMTAYSDIDQAVRLIKAGAGDYVTKPFEITTLLSRLADIAPRGALANSHPSSLRDARGEAEKAEIERTLIGTGGRLGEAARRLGVSRTTLWGRMKALGISRKRSTRSKP
jgi:DNA-binding NtrC family response regulator